MPFHSYRDGTPGGGASDPSPGEQKQGNLVHLVGPLCVTPSRLGLEFPFPHPHSFLAACPALLCEEIFAVPRERGQSSPSSSSEPPPSPTSQQKFSLFLGSVLSSIWDPYWVWLLGDATRFPFPHRILRDRLAECSGFRGSSCPFKTPPAGPGLGEGVPHPPRPPAPPPPTTERPCSSEARRPQACRPASPSEAAAVWDKVLTLRLRSCPFSLPRTTYSLVPPLFSATGIQRLLKPLGRSPGYPHHSGLRIPPPPRLPRQKSLRGLGFASSPLEPQLFPRHPNLQWEGE